MSGDDFARRLAMAQAQQQAPVPIAQIARMADGSFTLAVIPGAQVTHKQMTGILLDLAKATAAAIPEPKIVNE